MPRPPDEDKTRDVRIIIRALSEERDDWKRAAKRAGYRSMSSWLRALANGAAKRKKAKR